MLISPALAFHGTTGPETTGGGISMGAILPLIVILAVFLIALVFWGRKKGHKRKRRRGSRGRKR